jgi:acetate kinase
MKKEAKEKEGEKKKEKGIKVMIEVSARHCHLSQEEIDRLFGKDYQLKKLKDLSQLSDFAAEETVTIENKGKKFENVRVIGPARTRSYVEISRTDARFLGMETLLKVHGDEQCGVITVIGPKARINMCIITKHRHLHISDKEAKELDLKEGQLIKVKIGGERAVIFENVVVRIHPKYRMAVHLDTDEGNAAGIFGVGEGELII